MKSLIILLLLCGIAHAQFTAPAPVIDTTYYKYPESFVIDLANLTLEQQAAVDAAKSAIVQYQLVIKKLREQHESDSLAVQKLLTIEAALKKALAKSEELDSVRKQQLKSATPGFLDKIMSTIIDNAITFVVVLGAIILLRR